MALFGTSGIRMKCPSELTPTLAMGVGAAAGGKNAAFVVGYDGRPTGQMIKAAVAAGAASAGARVVDIGLCATPTLALHTQKVEGRGAMITASHNPPEYNGIKLLENGKEASKKIEGEVGEIVGGRKKAALAEWGEAGGVENEEALARESHAELILSKIDVAAIKKKNPTVVVDCGNAAALALMPELLERAGCSVVAINSDSPGNFARGLEPTEENLHELSSEIISCGADLGIAHDGDADRAIIFDEKGKMLGLDAQLAIAVQEILECTKAKKPIVVSTVESSLSLRETVEGAGAHLEITPVGSLFVAERMRKVGAIFGGEPCGEYIFPDGVQMPDGLMAGLFFVKIFCKRGKLSELAGKVKTYPMIREKVPCENGKKGKAMASIAKNWPFSKPKTEDGLRSDEKWGWVMVRPSGTEPIIRITLEAKNGSEAKNRANEIRELVKKACA